MAKVMNKIIRDLSRFFRQISLSSFSLLVKTSTWYIEERIFCEKHPGGIKRLIQ